MKGGDILDYYKRENLGKGCMNPLTNYDVCFILNWFREPILKMDSRKK